MTGLKFAFGSLLLIAQCSFSATYYVGTNGSDAFAGSIGAPWLTIAKASSTAIAGDRVVIGPGVYQLNVTNWASGTPGSPIIFEGTRGADGAWLTIIDPSVVLSNNWTVDAEFGGGVYRNTSASFPAADMHIENKRLAYVYTTNLLVNWSSAYTNAYSNGIQFLTLPLGTVLTMKQNSNQKVDFWNNVGALWASQGSTNWLRLADGGDPNGLDIRITRNSTTFATGTTYAGWRFDGMSNIVVSNVWVRNAFTGFLLKSCTNIVLNSNRVTGGAYKVAINTTAASNTVANSLISTEYYGWRDTGAWSFGNSNRANLYVVAKYLMTSASETFDIGISCDSAGSGNVIVGNTITNGIGQAVELTANLGTYPPYTNTVVASNTIGNWASIGILSSTGARYVYIHDNWIYDNNINLRGHKIDDGADLFRPVWFYRNRCWLPSGVATHFYFHCNSATKGNYEAEYNVYQNSFSGGVGGVEVSGFAYAKSGATNLLFCNNVFSGAPYWYSDDSAWKTSMTTFDYNVVTMPFPTYPSTNVPSWWGASNFVLTSAVWPVSQGIDLSGQPSFGFALNTETNFNLGVVAQRTAFRDSIDLVFGAKDVGAREFFPGRTSRIRGIIIR